MTLHIEDMEQQALFDWAKLYSVEALGIPGKLSDWLIAIPNGGKRNPREAARLKRQGVKSGVSDMFLPIPTGECHGLWIELKKPVSAFKTPSAANSSVTESQHSWLALMEQMGYEIELCYGFADAQLKIKRYLEQK